MFRRQAYCIENFWAALGLREENKEVRIKLSVVQRGGAMSSGGDHETTLLKIRKQFDSLREQTKAKNQSLEKLRDGHRDLELQAERSHQEDSPVTRNIRMLENRLDKALIKFNEAQSIKKTYEQIVKRLREERIGFDHQLAALERTFAAKQRDYEELLLLSGDANHARGVAQSELDHVRGGYEDERQRRNRELRERHQMVQFQRQSLEGSQRREMVRAELAADEAEKMGERSEKVQNPPKLPYTKVRVEQRTKINIFEAAFRKIKEATGLFALFVPNCRDANIGVSDVNEVIQKIVSQESTSRNLIDLSKENQEMIQDLTQRKTQIKVHVDEIKYSGPGGGHRRKLVDAQEQQLATALARLDRFHIKYERLAKSLIAVKAGVKHLQDKLECIRDDVGGKLLQLTDETTVRVMSENEKYLIELLARIRIAGNDGTISGNNMPERKSNFKEPELLQMRPYNQRIDLPLIGEDWHDETRREKDDFPTGEFDDELTRDKVKKAASQIMMAQDKKRALAA